MATTHEKRRRRHHKHNHIAMDMLRVIAIPVLIPVRIILWMYDFVYDGRLVNAPK